jgi:hypothetical protein
MKPSLIILTAIFLIFQCAISFAQTRSYQAGEKLTYDLEYGFISAGVGIIMVKDTILDKKHVNHVICRGETVGMADALFKVRDRYESFIEPKTDLPVKSVRSIREGHYKYYDEVTYNRDSSTVISKLKGTQPVPSKIQDILSAFYYARNFYFNDQLKKDQIITIMTYFSNELWPLRIRYNGTENVRTSIGKVECYKFTPITEVGRAFESNDDMEIWISRDENRIPIKIRFKLIVGSFTCELAEYSKLAHPFSSLKK